jgi:hypothetical protein
VREGGKTFTSCAHVADECENILDPPPDLVLLQPDKIPSGVMTLHLATQEKFEYGKGFIHARIRRKDANKDDVVWLEAFPKGEIDDRLTNKGLRQFSGNEMTQYWFTDGSSGSPLFLESGEQLAGVLSLSELGANEGKSPLHVAFIARRSEAS